MTGLAIAFVVALMTMMVIHHERFDRIRVDEWRSLPWDPAWPALPIARGGRELRADVAKAIYAFAGTKPEVMEYIPVLLRLSVAGPSKPPRLLREAAFCGWTRR